jgi:PAS domain S-box-containing protein
MMGTRSAGTISGAESLSPPPNPTPVSRLSPRDLLHAPGSLAREIIALLQEPFLVLDAEHRVEAASDPFYRDLGLRPDEVVGRVVYDLNGGDWGGEGLQTLLERLAPSQAIVEDHPITVPFGAAARSLLCTVRPIRTGANEVGLHLLSFRSPPPLPAAAAGSLRRLADEHVTDVVSLFRRDGTCLFVGSACEQVLGYPPEEWLALRPCDVVHANDRQVLLDRFSADGRASTPWRLTLRVRRKSGDYLWLDTAVRVVHDAELGELVHTSSRDVTERKRAEDAVQWLSRHVKLILDSAAEGIFGIDTRGGITFINPAAAHALGYPVSELMGQSYRLLLPPDDPRPDEIAALLADGIGRRAPAGEFVKRDGTRLTVEYSCNPARKGGAVVGGVVTFRDITDRLRSEATLRRSEWLAGVGQTALAVRHEVNNPLTTLLAEASMLEIGGNTPEEEREMIASIAGQARRIRDVVKRLTERQDDPSVRTDGPEAMLDLSEGGEAE